ncbi:hypothetical protein Tsubulata_014649, partial [Turnera subulata]
SNLGFADRIDRSSHLYAHDGEKNQPVATSRNVHVIDHGDLGSYNFMNENSRPGLIALEGCCRSEASQLLNDRTCKRCGISYKLLVLCINSFLFLISERPDMYSGSSASAWGNFRLPHQMMSAANTVGPSGSQIDFVK